MEKFASVHLLKTAKKKYSRYAKHVLGFRHFPEGRDGLKPVQRRALWALHQLGATDRAKKVATSRAVGECTGRFHPHEDETVVAAMTKISQSETKSPTIIGVGNWGTWEDPPAAKRYTKCYLSPYALEFFDADELSQVPLDPTYDGTDKEPRFLPAPVPHLLLYGCNGITPGARANVPPLPAEWVLQAMSDVLAGRKPKQPDAFAYRYGGVLKSLEKTFLTEGKGSATFAPILKIDEQRRAVKMLSLAPGVNPYALDEKLTKVPEYGGMSSEPSPDSEVCIYYLAKRGADLKAFRAEVVKRTRSRDSFSFLYINQVTSETGDVGYEPRTGSPLDFLRQWVEWRRTIVSGAAKKRIETLQTGIARNELMIRVIQHRSEILKILERGKSRDDIKARTAKLLRCTAEEADYVLGTSSLYRLASLEVSALKQRISDAQKLVRENQSIVKSPDARLLLDAERTTKSLAETMQVVEDIRRGELKTKKKKRHARTARS